MIQINKLLEETLAANPEGWTLKTPNGITIIPDIQWFVNKNIPEIYQNADIMEEIDDFVNESAGKNKGVYFFGPAGTGKTYQMYGLLRRHRLAYQNCKFINVPDWLVQLRLKFEDTANNMGLSAEFWINQEIKSKEILFVDDIGVEKVTDWNSEIIYRLINYRSENNLRTYFASNLSLNELAKQRDDRLASRIAGMSIQKEMVGKDRRVST